MNRQNKIIGWVLVIAAIVAFVKTADVLAYFAPASLNAILGFNVSYLYGIVSALLVEGFMLALHFIPQARDNVAAQISKWVLLAISLLCQIFDGFLATSTLAQQSDEMKFLFQFGVPALPVLILLMGLAIGLLPEDKQVTQAANVGLKQRLSGLWNGKAATQPNQMGVIDNGGENDNGQKRQERGENWQTISKKFNGDDYLRLAGMDYKDIIATYHTTKRTAYRWKEFAKEYLSRNQSKVAKRH